MKYTVQRYTIPADSLLAANTGPAHLPDLPFARAQEAVDAARKFVQDYTGGQSGLLPRSVVYSSKQRRIIFRAWRKLDSSYSEERTQQAPEMTA